MTYSICAESGVKHQQSKQRASILGVRFQKLSEKKGERFPQLKITAHYTSHNICVVNCESILNTLCL